MKDLRIESTGGYDAYPVLEISNNEDNTVELSIIEGTWSGYGKTINEAQADQIIAHLQEVFKKPVAFQFEINGETYQTQGELITTKNPRADGGIDTLTAPLSWLVSEEKGE